MSGIIKFLLRLPPEMHAEIKEMAEKERRSLHAQILVLLEEAIASRREQSGEMSKLAA